jgi:hypothetical protein
MAQVEIRIRANRTFVCDELCREFIDLQDGHRLYEIIDSAKDAEGQGGIIFEDTVRRYE